MKVTSGSHMGWIQSVHCIWLTSVFSFKIVKCKNPEISHLKKYKIWAFLKKKLESLWTLSPFICVWQQPDRAEHRWLLHRKQMLCGLPQFTPSLLCYIQTTRSVWPACSHLDFPALVLDFWEPSSHISLREECKKPIWMGRLTGRK